MSETNTPVVAFLPWLDLPNKVTVGPVDFIPITADACAELGLGAATEWLIERIAMFRDLSGVRRRSCTVAIHCEQTSFGELSPKHHAELHNAAQILAFACLAENDYWADWSGKYANSAAFRLEAHRLSKAGRYGFTIPITGGSASIGGIKLSDIAMSIPPQCGFVHGLDCKQPFLRMLAKMATQPDAYGTCVFESIRLFNSALCDDEWQSVGYVLANYYHAFNNLLLPGGKNAEKMKATMVALLEPHTASKHSRLRDWFDGFSVHRHVMAHGDARHKDGTGWHPQEHAVMAAFLFPLLVKCYLVKSGYEPDTEDLLRLQALELLADTEHPSAAVEEGNLASVWHNVLHQVRMRSWAIRIAGDIIGRR